MYLCWQNFMNVYIVFKKLYKEKVVYTLFIYKYVTFIEECCIATIEIFKHKMATWLKGQLWDENGVQILTHSKLIIFHGLKYSPRILL
jgi:hypothetical protein